MHQRLCLLTVIGLLVVSCGIIEEMSEDVPEVTTPGPTAQINPAPIVSGEPQGVFPYTSMNPPDLSRITISEPDDEGFVMVTGGARAVSTEWDHVEYNWVALAGMEVGTEACAELKPDGSFKGRVYAPPGITLYIAPAWMEKGPRDPDEEGGLCEHAGHGDGVLVRIPEVGAAYVTFGALPRGRRRLKGEHGPYTERRNFWHAEGDFTHVEITIRGLDIFRNACLRPALKIERLFDGEGRPRAAHDTSTQGIPVSPTGFMVESRYYLSAADLLYLEPECLPRRSDFDLAYDLPDFAADLPDGLYHVRIILGGWGSGDVQAFRAQNPFFSQEFEPAVNDQGLYGPVFRVGEPATPSLPWVLFAETASQGSGGARGIVPHELRDDFAFDTRVTLTPPQMILPRVDPNSGLAIPYRLEPWLPSVSAAPFRGFLPASPLIPLALPGGSIQVTVERPDGEVDTLGPAQFTQSVVAQSYGGEERFFDRPGSNHSFAGPNRTYGLTTGDDTFIYVFPAQGRYTIRVAGEVQDVWSNSYRGGGTYEVWIANALDVDLGTFTGTPMMVGDAYAPTVQVYPAMPAEIEVTIRYYPDSDVGREVVHTIDGRANRFGYFHPQGSPFIFDEPGEYRVDVLAWTDTPESGLWMGARTGASVVAEPESSFTLHGDTQSEGERWYFNNVIHGGCGEETCGGPNVNLYPIFRGDVVWFADSTNQQRPDLFVNDPDGLAGEPTVSDELRPLLSWAESGRDVYQYPEEATVWEYWYESSQRPGESIQARLLQNGTAHEHWYSSDNYNRQFGMGPEGDLPDDLKLLFGGAVHRGPERNVYAYYAAMDSMIPELTELGQRTCPPFQGAAGGPDNCGPLLTWDGREVDLFLTATGVQPGTILEVGDVFAFSGIMWPTLESKYTVTVTKPDGSTVVWNGQASPVGYVSDEGRTFVVDQPGRYRVHLALIHDTVVPSTGAAPDPPIVADGVTVLSEYGYEYPLSAVMGTFDSTFDVYAIDPGAEVPPATIVVEGDQDAEAPVRIQVAVDAPDGIPVYHTLHMPGFVLAMGQTKVTDGSAEIRVDRTELRDEYSNFDPRHEVYKLTLLIDTPGNPAAQLTHFRGNTIWSR